MIESVLLVLALVASLAAPPLSRGQEPGEAPGAASGNQNTTPQEQRTAEGKPEASTVENTITASESWEPPARQLVKWNEYKGPYMTIRFGAGFLYEIAAYSQDDESKEQFRMKPDEKVRDFRLLFAGGFPKFKRKVTWSVGAMYDGPTDSWLVRQTGVMIAVPELWGNFFIGRSKEGFSLNKVMVGYDGWTMERATINDASIPILADGIKWLGYTPKHKLLWNVGYYNDVFSNGQTFSTYSSQVAGRFAWLAIHGEENPDLLHIGVNLRWGKPVDDKLRLRSRPEAFPAPYFVDTGQFPSTSTRMAGPEIYYRRGSLLFGSEYWFTSVDSPSTGDPTFHGGDVVATWNITGEVRTYNTIGGFFKAVSPKRPVFQGGPGAWEAVLRWSYIDLDSGTVRGGKFWRFTPMMNWHLSDNVRLEMAYGYGHLNRFDLAGNTHFFQSRIQLQF